MKGVSVGGTGKKKKLETALYCAVFLTPNFRKSFDQLSPAIPTPHHQNVLVESFDLSGHTLRVRLLHQDLKQFQTNSPSPVRVLIHAVTSKLLFLRDLFPLSLVDSLNGSPALMSAVAAFQSKPKVNRDTLRRVRVMAHFLCWFLSVTRSFLARNRMRFTTPARLVIKAASSTLVYCSFRQLYGTGLSRVCTAPYHCPKNARKLNYL